MVTLPFSYCSVAHALSINGFACLHGAGTICLVEHEQGQQQGAENRTDGGFGDASSFAELLDTNEIGYYTVSPGDDGLIHTHNDATQDSESTADTKTNQPTDNNADKPATDQSVHSQ